MKICSLKPFIMDFSVMLVICQNTIELILGQNWKKWFGIVLNLITIERIYL